jgi:hypothetical protein
VYALAAAEMKRERKRQARLVAAMLPHVREMGRQAARSMDQMFVDAIKAGAAPQASVYAIK